jgi:hypothetical protein
VRGRRAMKRSERRRCRQTESPIEGATQADVSGSDERRCQNRGSGEEAETRHRQRETARKSHGHGLLRASDGGPERR